MAYSEETSLHANSSRAGGRKKQRKYDGFGEVVKFLKIVVSMFYKTIIIKSTDSLYPPQSEADI